MKPLTVILAAGDFPRKGGAAWQLLAAAKRVVCCDGAADAYRRRFRRWPDVIIGDLDSFGERCVPCRVIRDADQETNDLEKAMTYCAKRSWRDPVIVGAMGKREDHMIGNVFRVLEHGLEIVTDRGRFIPVCGKVTLNVVKGSAVSIFATDPKTRMTSSGLRWPLDGVRFRNLYCATLNRTTASKITLTATKAVYVYISERT